MAERSRSDTIQLKARMKEPLRAKLEEAAGARGVSLNAEMIHRLERSFEEFGKEETFLVARLLANAIQTIEAVTGKNWMDDPETHRQTQWACITILDAFRPPAGARSISTDPRYEGLVATESSTIGADAATDAILSNIFHATKAARLRMKKKGG